MKQRESRRRRRRSDKKRCNTLFGFIIVVIIFIITTIRRKKRGRIRRNATEDGMETLDEEVEEYSWRDVVLPALIPVVQEPVELERESRQRRRGRDILVAVDHGPNSQHALHWALAHLCRLADTLHFVHVVHRSHRGRGGREDDMSRGGEVKAGSLGDGNPRARPHSKCVAGQRQRVLLPSL